MNVNSKNVELIDPFAYITVSPFTENRHSLKLLVSEHNKYAEECWVPGSQSNVSKEYENAVFERDHHVCQFCGFQSKKYMQTVIRNGQEWRLDSVLTSCMFCAQCLTLETVAPMRSGVIVYLPEISQARLNQLLKIIYVARISQLAQAESSKAFLSLIEVRREKAKKLITDDPNVYVEKIQYCDSYEAYEGIQRMSKDLRLCPMDRRIITEADLSFNQFPQILAYWRSKNGAFGGLLPTNMDFQKIDNLIAKLQ